MEYVYRAQPWVRDLAIRQIANRAVDYGVRRIARRRSENYNLNAIQMPGQKRKGPVNAQGFRRKIRRDNMKWKVPRPIPGRSYRTRMATDREIVALHDLDTVDLTHDADLFGCLQIANVLSAPGLSRFTARYDRVRFLKLKVEFFATDYVVTAISTVSQSEKTTLTNKDVILRQKNCRFHNLKRSDGINCSRTFDVSKIAILGDHLNCDTLSSTLSVANATTMDCGIHFCILHTDMPYPNPGTSGGWHIGQEKIQIKKTFVCEFMGLQQTMAELD
jgi:hypothetical protein